MQTSLLKHRSKLDEFRVGELYLAATRLFFNPQLTPGEANDGSMWRSRVVTTEGFIIATCTDEETGIFVQLNGPGTATANDTMLVFGQKYCHEGKDMVRQNLATKIWS